MRGSSRVSLGQAVDRLESVLGQTDGVSLGEELFSVASLFNETATLRRSLTDPSRSGDGKAQVVGALLSGKVSAMASETVQGLVRQRWSSPEDLVEATDVMGVTAVLAAAERYGVLDDVSEELFRFERLVDAHAGLQQAVGNTSVAPEKRTALITGLLEGKACRETVVLVRHAVHDCARRHVATTLREYSEAAAARQSRGVARVEAAIPLTSEHIQRLQASLTRIYGRPMQINVDVVPEVVGGLRIQVADEVIDATTVNRLGDLRRRFAE